MSQATKCNDDAIELFLLGQLSSVEIEAFEDHLCSCDRCHQTLSTRTADPSLWEDARAFLNHEDPLQIMGLDHVLAQILTPTDDPRMMGRFGGYEITGVVGRGGMGIVLKGLDVSLDRYVAIKVLDPSYASHAAARQRFAREAQAAAAVVHDNVIAIYGVDHISAFPFLVMPYIKGESLQQRIDREAPLAIEDILTISVQIARGLSAAHDQGLAHRDIKPANILMPAGVSRVILTDFGLARAADDASLTRSGVIAGTPQYMSPEQIMGEAVDGRSDLFSLGSVIYVMACGHPPFRADTAYGVLRRIADHPHRRLSQIRNDTPVWLDHLVDRLLEKQPAARFQTAKQLADQLENCLAHVRQPTLVDVPQLTRVRRANRTVIPSFFAVVLLAIMVIAAERFWSMRFSETSSTLPAEGTTEVEEVLPLDPSDLKWDTPNTELDQLEADLQLIWKELVEK